MYGRHAITQRRWTPLSSLAGDGSNWAVLAFLGNLGFYSVVWSGAIHLMRKLPLGGNKLGA